MFWILTLLLGFLLYFFWEPLRSTEFILLLQGYRSPAVDYFFRAFTFLGNDYFYIFFFCIMLWCVDKPLGLSAAAVLLVSGAGSNLLKGLWALPRPAIEGIFPPHSYAFPSGHALTAVTLWGYLAVKTKKAWFWAWTIIVIIIVSFSRLILGFHFAGDVLGGVFLGMLFLKVFLWADSFLTRKGAGFFLNGRKGMRCDANNRRGQKGFKTCRDRQGSFFLLLAPALAFFVPFCLVFILPGESGKILGILAGGSAGYILEKAKIRSLTQGSWRQQLLKALIGILGEAGIFLISGCIFSAVVPCLTFLRYMVLGFWITFLAPYIFVRAALCPRDKTVI